MNFRYIQEIEKRIKQLRETEENTLEEAASHIIRTLRQRRRPAAYGSRGLFGKIIRQNPGGDRHRRLKPTTFRMAVLR